MIELYTHGTANGRKASIMLEELGLDYNVHVVGLFAAVPHTSPSPCATCPSPIESKPPDTSTGR